MFKFFKLTLRLRLNDKDFNSYCIFVIVIQILACPGGVISNFEIRISNLMCLPSYCLKIP